MGAGSDRGGMRNLIVGGTMTERRCPMCTGSAFTLGVFGKLRWWKCRHCGMEFAERIEGDRQNQIIK